MMLSTEEKAVTPAVRKVAIAWLKAAVAWKAVEEEGYDEEAIDCAIEYLTDIDFAEQCALLIEKRYMKIPTDRYELQKMCASISRYGYNGSEIKGGIKIFKEM